MKKTLRVNGKGIMLLLLCSHYMQNLTAQSGVADVGKSFANITKLTTGGTFNPNDVLEIRVTFAVRNVAPSQITAVQVFDTVPAKTTYQANTLRVTTNEGVTYGGPYTDGNDGDPASSVGGKVLINLGTGATGAAGGTIKNTDKPSFYSSTCILVACYRVRINAAAIYGDTIKIGGKVVYKISGVTTTRNFPLYRIILSQLNNTPCSNGKTISAASDSAGTFATGNTLNRAALPAFTTTYTKQNIGTNSPQDYNYSIVNNSSADGSTNINSTMPEGTALHRVFGLWDIAGDHTGAVNTAFGNTPATPGIRKGYMVVINSSYNTDTAYRETLSTLCPSTYYEFSGWFRNVCPRCGCDLNGKGSGDGGYTPGTGNDSSGVKPNINFEIDGIAYYTSGDVKYDRAAPWKKFGFTFQTKPGQTTANFLIRNNSPGGGGNDWAIDDINVSHCGPTLSMNYNPVVLGCSANPFIVKLSDTIRYLFSNSYVYYKWQRSNVGGTIWADIAGASGMGLPTLVGGQWQFVTNLAPFLALPADSGKYYRVIVATSAANLIGNCAYNDQSATLIKVINCGLVLATDFQQFKGQLVSNKGYLTWSASNEENIKDYDIEKSVDGINFNKINSVTAKNIAESYYNFTDPDNIDGDTYYRLKMNDGNAAYKYSKVVHLGIPEDFAVKSIINPFKNSISINATVSKEGMLIITLHNEKGQLVKSLEVLINKGIDNIVLDNIQGPAGIYFLSLTYNNKTINQKLVKIN
ncbi:MAG: T9SS type A sorting domain-containing protein [Ferruginibacter sp.]